MCQNSTIFAKKTNRSGTLTLGSLYPHVNRSKTVPTSHPEIITENFNQWQTLGRAKGGASPPPIIFTEALV